MITQSLPSCSSPQPWGLPVVRCFNSFESVVYWSPFSQQSFFHSILVGILKTIFTPSTASLLSYFIVFGVAFIATYIFTDILKRIMGRWKMGFGLRLFGALLGILKGLIFCGVIVFGVLLFCAKPTCDKVNTSKIASQIGKGMQTIVSVVPESVSNKVRGYAEEIKKKKLSKDAKPEKSDKDEDFKSRRRF